MSERNLSPLFTWRSALTESGLPPTARHVGLTLSLHMSERGDSCFPSAPTLADETGLSRQTVLAMVKILEDAGYLEVSRGVGRGNSNHYRAIVPEKVNVVTLSSRDIAKEADAFEDPKNVKDAALNQHLTSPSSTERVNVVTTNGQPAVLKSVNESVIEDGVGASSTDEAPQPLPDWGEFEDLKRLCQQLGAEDLLDLDFWKRVEALTQGTQIYYDDQLRKYLAWWESKEPSRRHRNRKRGFMSWIKEDISRENWRKRRAAQH